MDILDKYDEVRRGIYNNMIDPISSANLERLWQNPEAIKDTDLLFNTMKQAATDPKVAEQLQLVRICRAFICTFSDSRVDGYCSRHDEVLQGN